jgi:hypothetical protein
MAGQALAELSSHFDTLYARRGRPSKPPEQLIRALLLQVLYAIRSERQLMERIKYDLLFRWFVGLGIDEREWDATVFTKNRNGLVVTACATQSSTTAERKAALAMLDEMRPRAPGQRMTPGADKLYQERTFIDGLRRRQVIPHVAEYLPSPKWPSFLAEVERNDPGFSVSRKKRKLVEKVFGWGKLDSAMRKIKLRGLDRVDWFFGFLATAHNLVRMVKLVPAQ